jgi:acyl-Coa thioesterase superfamily protein/acyl-CoA thioesterase superfamily protein
VTAFYRRNGGTFTPTELTRGPWDPGAQHAGPPSALLGRAIEADGMFVGRITVDILRPVPLAPLAVSSRVLRPGRNVELVEARLVETDENREVARATAWRLRREHSGAGNAREPPPPGPDAGHERAFFATGQEVGYHTAMDYRFLEGSFTEPGPARVWLRMRQPLVAGEPSSPLARVLVAADSGNGVSAALDYRRHLFINTELTVHLIREPAGEWVQLDSLTRVGPHGVGLSESVLYDETGRLGRAAQTLLVRPR